jgi:hypothetical protein
MIPYPFVFTAGAKLGVWVRAVPCLQGKVWAAGLLAADGRAPGRLLDCDLTRVVLEHGTPSFTARKKGDTVRRPPDSSVNSWLVRSE